jgi:flagellar hook-length control protein FliK
MFGQPEISSSSVQTAEANQAAKAEIYQGRIFEQVERGIIKNATDGSKQIVLRLDPPELGKLTLSLTVAQGEVKALIRTESTATTQMISEQLAQLKHSLEEQGFKVSSLEVETRTQSHAGTDTWTGAEQHNQEQQVLEQARFLRLSRVRAKNDDVLAQRMQHVEHPASISASGLHIIA